MHRMAIYLAESYLNVIFPTTREVLSEAITEIEDNRFIGGHIEQKEIWLLMAEPSTLQIRREQLDPKYSQLKEIRGYFQHKGLRHQTFLRIEIWTLLLVTENLLNFLICLLLPGVTFKN